MSTVIQHHSYDSDDEEQQLLVSVRCCSEEGRSCGVRQMDNAEDVDAGNYMSFPRRSQSSAYF